MSAEVHGVLESVAEARRYHNWLAEVLSPHLMDPVLEIGAGIGTLATTLASNGHSVIASEPDAAMRSVLLENTRQTENLTVIESILLPLAHTLELQPSPLTALLSNVLEHIEDDVGALASLLRQLDSVNRLVLVVPAHRWAHTGLDDKLSHYRRYTKKTLTAVVVDAGWIVEQTRYFNPVGAFTWAASGHLLRRTSISPWQTKVVEAIVPILKAVDRMMSGRIVGQSVIVVATRPGPTDALVS